MVKFVVKSVVNMCGKNCGEIENLSDWKKNWFKKKQNKKQSPYSRTRGPAAPAVLVENNSLELWVMALD